MLISVIGIGIIFTIIIIFSSPRFSPIPYYPSNMKDKKNILGALKLKNNQTVVDLGAGDGVVIFEAARLAMQKGLNTRFVALDINPILIGIMWVRWLFHPNRKHIKIVWGDMFKINSKLKIQNSKIITFYLYISPWLIEKAVAQVLRHFPRAHFVSYYYPIKSMKKKEKKITGTHSTFNYLY